MPDDKPEVARATRIPDPFDFGRDKSNKLAPLIVDAVHRMTVSERRAASMYQAALARLRTNKAETVRLVSSAYRSLKPDRSLDRWSLIQLASEMKEPSALGLFQGSSSHAHHSRKCPVRTRSGGGRVNPAGDCV